MIISKPRSPHDFSKIMICCFTIVMILKLILTHSTGINKITEMLLKKMGMFNYFSP